MVFSAAGAEGSGEIKPHLDLELLHQFVGAQLLSFFFDLDLLRVNIVQGHLHPRLIDRGLLFDLAHHLVVRLADARHLELFHRIGHFLLPLSTAMVANGVEGLLSLTVLFAQESLLDEHGLVEGPARRCQLRLSAGHSASSVARAAWQNFPPSHRDPPGWPLSP